MIEWVQKRDGRVVPFNAAKIADAIFSAARAVGGEDRRQSEFLAGQVIHLLSQSLPEGGTPQVEQIQDLVEKVLIENGHARTAKAYILYRNRRTRIREQKSELMDAVSEVLQDSINELSDQSTPAAKLSRIALAASEQYTLHSLLPREFSLAHQRAEIHIDRLPHYTMAVAAGVIRPATLVRHGISIGQMHLAAARTPEQLMRMAGQLVLLAHSEMIGELLFSDLDCAVAQVVKLADQPFSAVEAELLAERMLHDLGLVAQIGGLCPIRVSVSIGLERSNSGTIFAKALLAVLARGLPRRTLAHTPQVVLQLRSSDPVSAQLRQLAAPVAREGGNPAQVMVSERSGAIFASGLHLATGEPGQLAQSFVNLPRIALEASSSSDFWAGIDRVYSLVARQLAHRFEVLSALSEHDLPLLWQLAGAGEQQYQAMKDVLQACQLSIVPVGVTEAFAVARMRFGSQIGLEEQEFIHLQRRIVEHWRSHYALQLKLAATAGSWAASRFRQVDGQAFPLVNSLWPEVEQPYQLAPVSQHFQGGQLVVQPLPERPMVDVVYAAPLSH
ncbi:MAG: anaerobic ribonucleoside-triphosphate reductase [Bacillota bacterium]|jgi:anaerobic ribonucleoside-triphosphate reductase